jgi:hypothetical protein
MRKKRLLSQLSCALAICAGTYFSSCQKRIEASGYVPLDRATAAVNATPVAETIQLESGVIFTAAGSNTSGAFCAGSAYSPAPAGTSAALTRLYINIDYGSKMNTATQGLVYTAPLGAFTTLNAQTVDMSSFGGSTVATFLTDAQKAQLSNNLQINVTYNPWFAETEYWASYSYAKTAKISYSDLSALSATQKDSLATAINSYTSVQMARYVTPYLAYNWTTYGITSDYDTATLNVPYSLDISPFAAALSDPDSTVWIIHNNGPTGDDNYKIDAVLVSNGTTDPSTWTSNYVQPVIPTNTTNGNTGRQYSVTTTTDLTNANLRIFITSGIEGTYCTGSFTLADSSGKTVTQSSYSTLLSYLTKGDSFYLRRNPSVVTYIANNDGWLWRGATRDWLQGDLLPPHVVPISGTLKKGTYTVTITATRNTSNDPGVGGDATVALYGFASSATSGIVSGGVYALVSDVNNSSVLDVNGAATADGTKVQLWANNSSNNQKWTITSVGNGYYSLAPLNAPSSRLDVSGAASANGTQMEIDAASNTSTAQQWKITATSDGYYTLSPACATGSLLDVYNNGTSNGTKVEIWTSKGGKNQKWKLVKQN